MDNPQAQPVAPTPTPVQATPIAQPIAEPAPQPSYSEGGFLDKIGEFKLVEYFVFGLFMSASIMHIYYTRQALNKLNE